jgi:hypothetical protein
VSIDVGLRDWAVVVEAHERGAVTNLVRKGGIHEVDGVAQFSTEVDRLASACSDEVFADSVAVLQARLGPPTIGSSSTLAAGGGPARRPPG